MTEAEEQSARSLSVMLTRLGEMGEGQSEVNFRGQVKATLIGLVAEVQQLREEVQNLREALSKGVDGKTY